LNFVAVSAWAQGTARVVQTCGTLPQAYTPGSTRDTVQDVNGNFCTNASGGGGGGGLSVVDQTAWTQGTSPFTPSGGVFNDTSTLSSGQEGTYRLTTKRAQIVDVDSTGNQLHTDLTSSIPAGTNLIGKVGIDQTTPGTTNAVSATNFPTTVDTNSGNVGASTPRVVLATNQPSVPVTPLNTTNAGLAGVKGGVGVVNGGSTYQAVAASQTATVLQTSTGAIGDYLSHCDIYPTSTSPGVVTVFDNANAAATNVIAFPGGASSISNLVPFAIPVGAISTAGAWKVTTGANVSVVCYGKFS
jgi:hypothetical protein